MSIPIYKTIRLSSHQKDEIYSQLSNMVINEYPLAIILKQLGDKQQEALDICDAFFMDNPNNNFPYGIYVIANCPEYYGSLNLIKDTKFLPKFFNQKSRPLNNKESAIFKKLTLKNKNFFHIKDNGYKLVLKEYADAHKLIHSLQRESHFLDLIDEGLKQYYGQEK